MYDFTKFKSKIKEVEEWLKKEYSGIRTGRATPTLLDGVKVESYGSMMSLTQVGSVNIEDPRTIRVVPWDMSLVKAIEKALVASNLGLAVSVDDKGLRVIFPELTSDRREQLVKLSKQKLEDAKVTLRGHREDVLKDLQAKEKAGGTGKDDILRFKNDLQKFVDQANASLQEIFEKKEKEVLS